MKTMLLLPLVVLTTVGMAFSQRLALAQVPEPVRKAFAQQYTPQGKVTWTKEKNGNYEAAFKVERAEWSVLISPAGKWIETEQNITSRQLPANILACIQRQYPNHKIVEAELIHSQDKIEYEVELKSGGKEIEVRYAEHCE